jgi:hypothetical protein
MRSGIVYNDGGRAAAGFKGSAGDCVCRAIAITTGLPYAEVYKVLADANASTRKTKKTKASIARRSARSGVYTNRKWFRDYMTSLGFEWVPLMKIGTGCRVHLDAKELPKGRIVAKLSKHLCAVIDGIIHDTHDPRRDMSWICSPDDGRELKPGESRNVNGIHTPVGGRCVYGYWRLDR